MKQQLVGIRSTNITTTTFTYFGEIHFGLGNSSSTAGIALFSFGSTKQKVSRSYTLCGTDFRALLNKHDMLTSYGEQMLLNELYLHYNFPYQNGT